MMQQSGFMTRQRGLGFFGFLLIVAVIVPIATALFKMGPLYQEFWTVRSVMKLVASPEQPLMRGGRSVAAAIQKQLDINSVQNVRPEDFKVSKTGEQTYEVAVDYERRVHLFFNIDAIAHFAHQETVTTK